MSAYHVVITYNPVGNQLNAQFYDAANVPLVAVPPAFTATYNFFRNGVLFTTVSGVGSATTVAAPTPFVCPSTFSVTATYTVGLGGPVLTSTDSIIVGTTYSFGNYLAQVAIPGGVSITLNVPAGLGVLTNLRYYRNGVLITPTPTSPFVAQGNGIYEVTFTSPVTGLTYYSTIEVTGSTPASYVRILGSDGNLYGTLGVPLGVASLSFTPVGAILSTRNRIYVNGVQVSDGTTLSLVGLVGGDRIDFVSVDFCGNILATGTTILPCGILPPPVITTIIRQAASA